MLAISNSGDLYWFLSSICLGAWSNWGIAGSGEVYLISFMRFFILEMGFSNIIFPGIITDFLGFISGMGLVQGAREAFCSVLY